MTVNYPSRKKLSKFYSIYRNKGRILSLLAVGFLVMIGTVLVDTSGQANEQRYYDDWLVTCSGKASDVLCNIGTPGVGASLYLSRYGYSKNLILFLLLKTDVAKLMSDMGILRFRVDSLGVLKLLPVVDFVRSDMPPHLTISNDDVLFSLLDSFQSGKIVSVTWQERGWPAPVNLSEFSLHGFKSAFAAMVARDSAAVHWKSQRYGPALMKAASSGDSEEVQHLIGLHADPNFHDSIWRTPLHAASTKGHYSVVQILIRAGAKGGATDILTGATPLHDAARNGRLQIVRFLLQAGVQIDIKDHSNKTPLHEAAEKGEIDVIRFLISQGASTEMRDKNGRTPATIAREEGHIDAAELLNIKRPWR